MTKEKKLESLCIEIFAHSVNDYEVTLSGNGTNPCEASNVALSVLSILHKDGRKWRKENTSIIEARASVLCKELGDE